MQKNPRKLIGFTLVELLVVIAVIAILAAILFPVFASAREDAIERLMEGRTTVLATHRLSAVRSADVIFVLERGQLVEQGDSLRIAASERRLRPDGAPQAGGGAG